MSVRYPVLSASLTILLLGQDFSFIADGNVP
jgi:hypothetical protein